jgi:hypothetical protein
LIAPAIQVNIVDFGTLQFWFHPFNSYPESLRLAAAKPLPVPVRPLH